MWSVPNHFAVFTTRLLGSINPIERPFTPDKTRDLSTVWKRQGVDQITPDTRRLAKPKALMFFHMPLYVFSLSCISIALTLFGISSLQPGKLFQGRYRSSDGKA